MAVGGFGAQPSEEVVHRPGPKGGVDHQDFEAGVREGAVEVRDTLPARNLMPDAAQGPRQRAAEQVVAIGDKNAARVD